MGTRRLITQTAHGPHGGIRGRVSEQMLNQARWELYNPATSWAKSGVELAYNQV